MGGEERPKPVRGEAGEEQAGKLRLLTSSLPEPEPGSVPPPPRYRRSGAAAAGGDVGRQAARARAGAAADAAPG